MAKLPYTVPYDPQFLGGGFVVPPPTPRCRGALVQGGQLLDYIHYSLAMHADRKTLIFAAHNIDKDTWESVGRDDNWGLDPRVGAFQTGPEAYPRNSVYDRGHMVRRADVTFGGHTRAKDANEATFYYTNAVPQHEAFNQDDWLALEDWVLRRAGDQFHRLCVFTGPLYSLDDRATESGTRVPSACWKVVVLRDPTAAGDDLSVAAFLMKQNSEWQTKHGETINFRLYQVSLEELGVATGLDFGPLAQLDEYVWRRARFRDGRASPWIPITGPDDVRFYGARRRAAGVRAARAAGPAVVEVVERDCGCGGRSARRTATPDLADQVGLLHATLSELLLQVTPLLPPGGGRARLGELHRTIDRIVGGTVCPPGAYPSCACLGQAVGGGRYDWFCTGVLVAPRVVVTAAHCAPVGIDRVLLGTNSINSVSAATVYEVASVHVHPDYAEGAAPAHDICVVVLARDAAVTPAPVASTTALYAVGSVQLVGFGYNDPTRPIGFGTKREVALNPTVPTALTPAELAHEEVENGFDHRYELSAEDPAHIRDTCNGDSGGPAYAVVDGSFAVAALTSRASLDSEQPCGEGGVYTLVAPYVDWVRSVVGSAGDAITVVDEPGTVPSPAATPPAPRPDPLATAEAGGTLRIVAALPNPEGQDDGKEWVELENFSSVAASLDGVTLGAEPPGSTQALSGSLAGGGVLRVPTRFQLYNKGASLTLRRAATTLHQVRYEKAGSGQVVRFGPETPVVESTVAEAWRVEPC